MFVERGGDHPPEIDPRYTVDIDTLNDWRRAEWLVTQSSGEMALDMVFPGRRLRHLPEKFKLLVLDFDGVLTDNRVWVGEDGYEQVAAYRSDSLALRRLRQAGVDALVISMEVNPVVTRGCKKMNMPGAPGESMIKQLFWPNSWRKKDRSGSGGLCWK